MANAFFRRNPWLLLALAYLLVVGLHLAAGTFFGSEQYREKRGFALQHVLRMSRPLLKDGRSHELNKYLADAQSTGLVDWYEISGKGRTDTLGMAPNVTAPSEAGVAERNGWVWANARESELSLRLASGYGTAFRLRATFESELARAPMDLTFALFAASLLFFSGASQGGQLPRRESRSAKVARAEAPRKPIEAGDFTGVCGRAVLLGQAKLAEGDPNTFVAALDEFYADAAALIARYRGRLHGVHGHELLFTFQEKDVECRLAAAAARDLAALGTRRGFPIAAALSHGRIHGAQLLHGFALIGDPVEETAELLQRRGKEAGLWISDSFASMLGHAPTKSGKRNDRSLPGGGSLADAIEAARRGNAADLQFHRGDEALHELLRSLASDHSWEKEAYVAVVGELRRNSCRRCGPTVVDAYRGLLAVELSRKDSYRLSSAVALAATLLSRAQVDRALEKLFLQAAAVKDRRVRANAVELFTKFFPEREIPELRPLIRDEDNRVSANALIKAACERFDEKVIAKIDERVRGGSVAHVASALHAMGEIAAYYRQHDPLFLGSKISFLQLFEGIPHLVAHPNSMIRRQALLAAQKLQSEPVEARLRDVYTRCTDPELLTLFESIYGWRKDARQSA